MRIFKFSVAALGLLALTACSQPPAPPAYVEVPWKGTVAPPVPAPSFTIPFRTGSVHLSRTDLRTIQEAAKAYYNGGASVKVTGHTDTVGSVRSNERLSNLRAKVVARALVRAGVPAGAITTLGVGETDLAVPTGDHVNEKANRRVVVDVR